MATIESFIKVKFPTATTGKQIIPLVPPANSFYVILLSEERETETRYHYRYDRSYQIVHLAARPDTLLADIDTLSRAVYQTETIGHIRVNSFNVSQPFMTENDLYAITGILDTSVRESRDQTAYPKINNVNVRRV